MLEMLKARKEALQERGVKGFTLMEMLIVIAIIAVLVAIAIPVMTAQLDKANAETDAANIRSGYATVTAKVMLDNVKADKTYYLNNDGSVTETKGEATYTCKGNSSSIQDTTTQIGSMKVGTETSDLKWTSGQKVEYSYAASTGAVTMKGV